MCQGIWRWYIRVFKNVMHLILDLPVADGKMQLYCIPVYSRSNKFIKFTHSKFPPELKFLQHLVLSSEMATILIFIMCQIISE